ncbi:MAG: EamA family transporter [Burkholderiaceae bacterium]|nr:EamA family transporter [Burkholderiaceae bacterium]
MLTLPPLLWGGNVVAGRMVVADIAPVHLNLLRWSLALAILLPLGWRAFASAASRQQLRERWVYLAVIGLLGVGVYNSMQYLALRTSTPVNVTLIAASTPIWMMVFGALFFHHRPRLREIAGALLSLAGVATVMVRGDWFALARVQFVAGDLLMLVATACWAGYSWLLARPPRSMLGEARPDWNWAEFLCIQMAFGALWAGLGAGIEQAARPGEVLVHLTPLGIAALLYVAIGPSIIAYRMWGLGVQRGGPALAGLFGNLQPVFAALLSAPLLGEWPHPYHGAALALILAGIWVSTEREHAVASSGRA